MRRVLIPLAVFITCAALIRAFIAGFSPMKTGLATPTVLAGAVHNAILGTGLALCVWYLITAAALVLGQALAIAGVASRRLQQGVGRYGAPLLRKFATWSVAGSLAFGPSTVAFALPEPHADSDPGAATSTSELGTSRNAAFLVDLGWQPTSAPEVALSPPQPSAEPSRNVTRPPEPNRHSPAKHTVVRGETLWGIAEAHLQQQEGNASPARVAAYWPQLHHENFAEIGADPDFITPGLHLRIPPLEES